MPLAAREGKTITLKRYRPGNLERMRNQAVDEALSAIGEHVAIIESDCHCVSPAKLVKLPEAAADSSGAKVLLMNSPSQDGMAARMLDL